MPCFSAPPVNGLKIWLLKLLSSITGLSILVTSTKGSCFPVGFLSSKYLINKSTRVVMMLHLWSGADSTMSTVTFNRENETLQKGWSLFQWACCCLGLIVESYLKRCQAKVALNSTRSSSLPWLESQYNVGSFQSHFYSRPSFKLFISCCIWIFLRRQMFHFVDWVLCPKRTISFNTVCWFRNFKISFQVLNHLNMIFVYKVFEGNSFVFLPVSRSKLNVGHS